jgi:hypothetical protein
MTATFTITADVNANWTENPLGLEVWLNEVLMQDFAEIVGPTSVSILVNDNVEQEHELKFVLKNKTQDHTKVDETGNILQDSVVEIKNLRFDNIEIGHVFYEKAVYHHDFNGSGADTQEKFYGTMGCNGTVSLKFITPMYLWLLENI